MGVGGQSHAPAVLCPGTRRDTHCTGGWVGPRAGAVNLDPTGIRSPDHPARSKALYRLRYPVSPLSLENLKLSMEHVVLYGEFTVVS